jgi:hypothetical protein
LEQSHGLRHDAVKGEEAIEIRRRADPDSVEDGAAILGVDHAPRIGNASSDWFRDSRGHADAVDLDPPIYGWNARRMKPFVIGR